MDKQPIRKPINRFLAALPKTLKVDKILIFGSYAQKTRVKSRNDIDILVISDNFKQMDEDTRLDILYKASRFIKPEIHPWGATKEELDQVSSLTTLGFARNNGFYMYTHLTQVCNRSSRNS